MKTKHLFFATALMASLAACTNEDIVSEVQQNVASGRPTVDNVKLTFGEGVDSRLIYNKGWKWEATDQIGALLMDNVKDTWHSSDVWQNKYELTNHIHTSYPFSYDAEDGTWGTPGKMLEGNYFFAYPWESYDGQRQVAHSLINQKQTGITADVRVKSYADNQFFIGYDRIIAGTHDFEALNNVNMTSVLGAIELRITNVGTQTYNINKVVLSGDGLASQLTFDPTSFNSANYLGYDWETPYYDLEEAYDGDEKKEALRAVVKSLGDEDNDKFAQIIIEGEDRALLPDAKNTAYVLVMANPYEVNNGTLNLSIYADEGMVANIDLTKVNDSASSLNLYGYKTDTKVTEIHPEVTNVIGVQLDDNAFEIPEKMNIYNSQDLEQLIAWNATISGKRDLVVTLEKDVTLTAEAYETLVAKKNMTLKVEGTEKILTLAEEIPADVLENENLDINSKVNALCDLELVKSSNAHLPESITVAKGAELTINDAFATICDIVNNGTLTIGENANIKNGDITNNGTMTVAKEALVVKNSTVQNNGTLEINGDVKTVSKNAAGAKIVLGKNGSTTVTTNKGTITTDGDLAVTTNEEGGVVEYEGGELAISTNKGESRADLSGAVDAESTEDLEDINTWVITADITFDNKENALSYNKLIVKDGVDVTVEEGTEVTITKMTVEGSTTIEGEITVTNLVVEEDARLTVDKDAVVYGKNISNDGVVVNNGDVYVDKNKLTGEGDWRKNDAIENGADVSTEKAAYEAALLDAIREWAEINNASAKTTIDNLNYNLKESTGKTTVNGVEVTGAAALFGKYYELTTDYTTYEALGILKTKFNAYKKVMSSATVTGSYTAMVNKLLQLYKGEIAPSTTQDAKDEFTPLTEALTWTEPTNLAGGAARIYVDTKFDYDGNGAYETTVTAADMAKRAFQSAVISDEVKNGNENLTAYEKAMIITNGANNAPAGSQVLKTDNIYRIFNETNGIRMKSNWSSVVGGDVTYNTFYNDASELESKTWTVNNVKTWVKGIADYTGNDADGKIAKANVIADNYAIYQESRTWSYSDWIIKAIIADYNGFNVLTTTGVLPANN